MLFLAATLLLAQVSPPSPLAFPNAPGTVWHFKAAVQWTLENSNKVRSADINWDTTVLSTHRSDATTVIVLSGFPTDLVWYEPERQARVSLITIGPEGLYLYTLPDQADIQKAVDQALKGEPAGDRILLSHPRVGDCLGGTPGRHDGRYCWHVEGKVTRRGHNGWAVAYRTNPDHQLIEFVPEVGVTRFEFEHHGTVASARAELKSVSSPSQ